jgi:hypothetical protein
MLFCDQCGTEFASGILRQDSKYCTRCGKELSDFIKSQCVDLYSPPRGKTDANRKRSKPSEDDDVRAEKKSRKKDMGEEKEGGLEGSGRRETRGRPRKNIAVVIGADDDQTTSTTSREDEVEIDTEVPLSPSTFDGVLMQRDWEKGKEFVNQIFVSAMMFIFLPATKNIPPAQLDLVTPSQQPHKKYPLSRIVKLG